MSSGQAASFSESTIEKFKDCFLLYAKEGYISNSGQLLLIMRSLGCAATKQEAINCFNQFSSTNGDQQPRLDFAAFMQLMARYRRNYNTKADVEAAFEAIDRKRSGYLTIGELQQLLQKSGEQLHSSEVARLLKELDADGTGSNRKINYTKLLDFLTTAPVVTLSNSRSSRSSHSKKH